MQFAIDYLAALKKALDGLRPEDIGTAVSWMKKARDRGRFIYVCGNGGSASIASQMVVDLLKGASVEQLAGNLASQLPAVQAATSVATPEPAWEEGSL